MNNTDITEYFSEACVEDSASVTCTLSAPVQEVHLTALSEPLLCSQNKSRFCDEFGGPERGEIGSGKISPKRHFRALEERTIFSNHLFIIIPMFIANLWIATSALYNREVLTFVCSAFGTFLALVSVYLSMEVQSNKGVYQLHDSLEKFIDRTSRANGLLEQKLYRLENEMFQVAELDHQIQFHAKEKRIDVDKLIKFCNEVHVAVREIWRRIKADLIRAIFEFAHEKSFKGSYLRGRHESERGLRNVLKKFPLVKVNDYNFQQTLRYAGRTAIGGIMALIQSIVLDVDIPKEKKVFSLDEQALLDDDFLT